MARILVVDDQPMVLKCVKSALGLDGHDVATVCAGDLALKLLGSMSFDIIITDYAMPRMDGLEFLRIAKEKCPGVPIIMITGYGTPDTAMNAMNHGAFDYLPKPFSLKDLRETVNAANEYVTATRKVLEITQPKKSFFRFVNIVAASTVMADICRRIEQVSKTDDPVLLDGEAGVGKELLARTIHAQSVRRDNTFYRVDCANLDDGESIGELLEHAETGSIYFQDISAMPMSLQEELDQVLATRTYHKGTYQTSTPLDVRVIASTTLRLKPLVDIKKFLPDLYLQLRGHEIEIPPLRERPEDVRVHIGQVLRQVRDDPKDFAAIDPDALLLLETYSWPGNVDELQEIVRNACVMAGGERVRIAHLPKQITGEASLLKEHSDGGVDLQQLRGRSVKNYLQDKGNQFKALLNQIDSFTR